MAFCSGLWIPLFMLPHGLRMFANFLPAFHMSQLALNVVGMGMRPASTWPHVEGLLSFSLICLGLAAWGYWRDEGKLYG
jgi:ABC-2 type transport system permease protein